MSTKRQTMKQWLKDMEAVYEALTTGGQEIYVEHSDLSQWAGMHVSAGELFSVGRSYTFTFEGPKEL